MQPLPIDVLDIDETSAIEKIVLHIIHHPFYLAFSTRPPDRMGFDAKPIMIGKIQKQRMKFPRLNPHLLHVVVEHRARPPAEELKSFYMTIDERL